MNEPLLPSRIETLSTTKFDALLQTLSPSATNEALEMRARTDLAFFARHFFPELCRLPPSRLHQYLFDRRRRKIRQPLQARRGEMDVVLAPRGAAKSTLISLVFPIHALLYQVERYIVLISATMRQACGRLSALRAMLLENERLREVYKGRIAEVTRRSSRSLFVNGVQIDAFSAGTELRGISTGPWRPTWIILDDAERSDRAASAAYRQGLAEWFAEVVENLGAGYTHIDLIGTLLHRDALPAALARRPDVTARTFCSIMSESQRTDLWEQWRALFSDLEDPERLETARRFFNRNRAAMLKGTSVLWPAKENYYDLMIMRVTRGRAAFDKEQQNAPLSDDSVIFKVEQLRRFELATDERLVLEAGEQPQEDGASPQCWLEDLRIFGFWDPALGGKGGDFAAVATVGLDAAGYLYVLDVWMQRAAPSQQIEHIFDLHERWRYEQFGLETNAFQKLLLEPLERERARRRAAGRPWDMPLAQRRHAGDKAGRIMALEPPARAGWIAWNRDLSADFWQQLEQFPTGRHDDGPDAVAAAVDLARRASPGPLPAPAVLTRRSRRAVGGY